MEIFRCRKKLVTQPCFWLSNISQKIFWCSKGTAPAAFFFWSPVIFLSMSPANPVLSRSRVASCRRAGQVLHERPPLPPRACTSSALETITSR